jgi:hypothetical protein
MRTHRPWSAAVLAGALVAGLAACGGSDKTAGAGTPSPSKPARDLRVNSQLEKYVTEEWNHNVADPADANYAAGVTVTKVACVPQTGTTRSTCVITFSAGAPKKFDYIVAGEGTSAERSEPTG